MVGRLPTSFLFCYVILISKHETGYFAFSMSTEFHNQYMFTWEERKMKHRLTFAAILAVILCLLAIVPAFAERKIRTKTQRSCMHTGTGLNRPTTAKSWKRL